jgi:hypothetical protein
MCQGWKGESAIALCAASLQRHTWPAPATGETAAAAGVTAVGCAADSTASHTCCSGCCCGGLCCGQHSIPYMLQRAAGERQLRAAVRGVVAASVGSRELTHLVLPAAGVGCYHELQRLGWAVPVALLCCKRIAARYTLLP